MRPSSEDCGATQEAAAQQATNANSDAFVFIRASYANARLPTNGPVSTAEKRPTAEVMASGCAVRSVVTPCAVAAHDALRSRIAQRGVEDIAEAT